MNVKKMLALRAASAPKRNPYVQTLLRDREVHERLGQGVTSARVAYLRATRRGDLADALLDDRRTRRELRRMVASFRQAAARIRGAKARKRRRNATRFLVPAVVVGGAGALAAGAAARKKQSDADSTPPSEFAPPAAPSGVDATTTGGV